MATALRMLEHKEYREISVLDLVAESEVNRNTFYYHFKDMPALMVQLGKRGIERSVAGKTDVAGKLSCLVENMYLNRVRILHVYSSMERTDFDEGLEELCEYLVSKLNVPGFEPGNNSRALLLKSCLYGLASACFAKNMDEESLHELVSACAELAKNI